MMAWWTNRSATARRRHRARGGTDGHLLPVRVLDGDRVGSSFDVASGIVQAVDRGAQVINMSLGMSGASCAVQSAIRYARGSSAVVVAPTGNDQLGRLQFPASMPGRCRGGPGRERPARTIHELRARARSRHRPWGSLLSSVAASRAGRHVHGAPFVWARPPGLLPAGRGREPGGFLRRCQPAQRHRSRVRVSLGAGRATLASVNLLHNARSSVDSGLRAGSRSRRRALVHRRR
jgi:hypothetical protein